MKKIILTLALTCSLFMTTKAQENEKPGTKTEALLTLNNALVLNKTYLPNNYPAGGSGPDRDYKYYVHQSRNRRIIGLSLLGGGLICGVSAILISSNNSSRDYAVVQRTDRTVETLFILSAATGIASIPFMILAHASKNKARAALAGQKTFIPGKATKYVTGITLSIPIGK